MTKRDGHVRVKVLCEDSRTQSFVLRTLEALGVDRRRIRFDLAPSGGGAAEAWVLARYPGEVKVLRAKNYQENLALVAIRDGDAVGVERRKVQLDDALEQRAMRRRDPAERIAVPVPTWAIENWLLALLGRADIDEARGPELGGKWKDVFDHEYGGDVGAAIQTAAVVFADRHERLSGLPSLPDGRAEFDRVFGG